MRRTLGSGIAVAAVYLLALGSAAPLDVVGAGVVAAAALAVGGRPAARGAERSRPPAWRRAAGAPAFAAAVARDVVAGTVAISLVVLGRRPADRDGVVEIPIGERTDEGVVVTALALTLSPGEVLVDVDRERRVMLVHVLDASDPAAIRRRHQELYERRQRAVAP